MTNDKITQPVEIDESELENANGGLLLPAVQKVREAAARTSAGAQAPEPATAMKCSNNLKQIGLA